MNSPPIRLGNLPSQPWVTCLGLLTPANRTGRLVYHLSGAWAGVNEIWSPSWSSAQSFLSIGHLQAASQWLLFAKRQKELCRGNGWCSNPPHHPGEQYLPQRGRARCNRSSSMGQKRLGITELTNLTHILGVPLRHAWVVYFHGSLRKQWMLIKWGFSCRTGKVEMG